jgi:hypothetical protein
MNPKPKRRPAVRPQVISGAQLARRRDAVLALAEAGGTHTLIVPPGRVRLMLPALAGAGLILVSAGKCKLSDRGRNWLQQLARGGNRGPLLTTTPMPSGIYT